MKICILTHTFPRFKNDTSAPFMHGLCDGLSRGGNIVFVLTPFSTKFDADYLKSLSYTVIPYKYIFWDKLHLLGYSQTLINDKKLKVSAYLLAPFMIVFGVFNLIQLVRREKIDVISAHWILPNGVIAAVVKKLTGVKVISTLPGSDVHMAKANRYFRALAFFAARNSDGITSNSWQLKEDLKTIGGVIRKFRTIIYGVDSHVFKPDKSQKELLRKKYRCSKDDILIVSVGRLVEKKGFLYLVKAAKNVIAKHKNVIFIIVGDGDQKKLLIDEVARLGISENFRFPGTISYNNLVHYYNLADTFILPSIRDSEGNLDDQSVSVIEAMSCGVPVITTDFPGYRSIIDNKKDGYLVAEANTKKIAEVINTLVESPKLRINLGRNARKKVVNHFTWKAISQQYTDFFQSLML